LGVEDDEEEDVNTAGDDRTGAGEGIVDDDCDTEDVTNDEEDDKVKEYDEVGKVDEYEEVITQSSSVAA